MKIYYRPINKGETFCTSIKIAKSFFKNTEVKLCFGEFSRRYNPYSNEIGYGYYKKHIFGTVVATMVLHPRVNCPLLCFYVIKTEEFSNELRNIFQNDILHQLLEIYNEFFIENSLLQKDTVIWVEWINDKFVIHKFIP